MDFERTRQPLVQTNIVTAKPQYMQGINLDTKLLELMSKMLVTDSQYIKRTQLTNLQSFINSIDPKQYINDPDKSRFISFIKKGLEGRLQYNINDPELIVRHINGGMLDDGVVDVKTFTGLNASEIYWINSMISETLKYDYVYRNVDKLMDICTRFKTGEYGTKSGVVEEFEKCVSSVQNDFRRVRNEDHTEAMFSLKDGYFEGVITDAYNQLSSPRRKLRTGMQGLNELLGGGFESGRLYVFFGLPGEGKSSTMLDLMYQLKKYNPDYKTKDPTKTPCIVMLTMENTIVESIERLFGLACIRNNSMTEYSLNEVIRMLREEGELKLDLGSPIDIIIKYKPTNSVDTTYLYTLCEDLEDQGLECIAMFQDYIGRIRSTERYSDTRLEYGCVTDEFKTFAENRDIPVITASQLNRDASKHIDEGRKSNKSDLVRFIGRSNISESMLILNNIDAGFMIAPEITNEGDKFLGVQRIKIRYKASDREYVYLPYIGNTLRLVEDIGGEPTFRTTMRPESEIFDPNRPRKSQYHINAINELGQVMVDDEDNVFKNGNFISSGNIDDIAAYSKNNINLWNPIVFANKHDNLGYNSNGVKLWEPIVFFN